MNDIAAMIAAGVQVDRSLAIARQIFKPQFAPAVGLRAMVYYKDLPKLSMKTKRTLIAAAKRVKTVPEVARASRRLSEEAHGGSGAASPRRRRLGGTR